MKYAVRRPLLAFAIAPAVPMLLLGVLIAVSLIFIEISHLRVLIGPLVFWLFFSYPSALVLGIPLYVFAREFGWTKYWQLAIQFALLAVEVPLALMALILATGSSYRGIGTGRLGLGLLKVTTVVDWLQFSIINLLLGAIAGVTLAFVLRPEAGAARPVKVPRIAALLLAGGICALVGLLGLIAV